MNDQPDPNQREDVPFPMGFVGRRAPAYAQPQVAMPQYSQEQIAQAQAVLQQAQAQAQMQPQGYPVNAQGVNGQAPYAQQHYQPPASSPEYDAVQVRQRLANLKVAAQAGLFDAADFMVEVIGNYQQNFQQQTGQALSFEEAVEQVCGALALATRE